MAICEVVRDLLKIMSWIISSFEKGSLGVMLQKDGARIRTLEEVGFSGRDGRGDHQM